MSRVASILVSIMAAIVVSAGTAAADYVTECPYSVTNVAYNDVLNIRAWPSPKSRIVGFIPPDGNGVILERWKDNWGRITYDGIEGWVNMNYLGADCH